MNTNDSLLLEIKNLTIDFNQGDSYNRVIDNISFKIPFGRTVGVVGESGSGKSVTALTIMGLLQLPPAKITSGKILFNEDNNKIVDLLKLNSKEKNEYRGKRFGMIFQEPMTSLNPVMKCGEQVAEIILKHKPEGIKTKKQALQKVLSLFKEVELPRPEQILNVYPHQISGGQKQRVMIAMAIACKPDLLIADEPTTALDVTIQKTILVLIKKLQEKYRMSILFITHDLSIITDIADKVIIMNKGKVVEEGITKQIFEHPKNSYTKGLLACRPPLNKRLSVLPTVSDFISKDNNFNIHNISVTSYEERKSNHEKIYANSPILKIENLKTWFPVKQKLFSRNKEYVKAVDNVSFEVYSGETLGLVGESGCGKTTLGRSILRLIEPNNGKIIYKNIDIRELMSSKMRELRKEIQIIFQDPYSSLNPRITVGRAIVEPMTVHNLYNSKKEQKEKALNLLKRVGLSANHFDRYPHEFSGGQRQRICIARALAVNPKLIICDESVSALDISVQAQVLNLLNELKKDFGFTYIFISHDLSVVRYMSDRIIVMNKGKIDEIDEADKLFQKPKTDYTKKLLDAIPGKAIIN